MKVKTNFDLLLVVSALEFQLVPNGSSEFQTIDDDGYLLFTDATAFRSRQCENSIHTRSTPTTAFSAINIVVSFVVVHRKMVDRG